VERRNINRGFERLQVKLVASLQKKAKEGDWDDSF
jgi:hypothetical protein